MGWDIDRFVDKDNIIEDLVCTICTDVVDDPLQTPCDHLFCNECITQWLKGGQKTCPVDQEKLTLNALKQPSRMMRPLINKLTLKCKNYTQGCKLMSKYEDRKYLLEHENEGCLVIQKIRFSKIQKENDVLKKEISSQGSKVTELSQKVSEMDNYISAQENKIIQIQQKHNEVLKHLKKQGDTLMKALDQNIADENAVSQDISAKRPSALVPGSDQFQSYAALTGMLLITALKI